MNAATRFLSALMAPYPDDPDLRLEIRPLWPEWKQAELYPDGDPPWYWRSQTRMREWFRLTAPEAAACHALGAASRTDVYMGVLPRLGRKGGQADVPLAGWLWADVDGGVEGWQGSVALVKASGLPAPHLAVVSGGGVHCYWRLSEVEALPGEADRAAFKELLQRLVQAIGGDIPDRKSPNARPCKAHADSSRADSASILRVPGTWNWKRQTEPRAVQLVRCQMEVKAYSLTRWEATLPAMPAPVYHTTPLRPGEERPLPRKAEEIRQAHWPPGTRHEALRDLLAIARGFCGYEAGALYALAEQFAQKNAARREWALALAKDTVRRITPSI